MKNYSDVIIIGGGIAGLNCALHLKLYGIESIVFERDKIGGIANYANSIFNIPFFNTPLSGKELRVKLNAMIKNRKLNIIKREVVSVNRKNGYFYIKSDKIYTCKYLVIATGSVHKKIKYNNRRIIYKPQRDILKNKDIVVYGGGDIAFDFALTVSEYANVKIIMRGNIKANNRLVNMIKENNISIFTNNPLINIEDREGKLRLLFQNKEVMCDYMLVAIGRKSNTEILNNIEKNENIFIIGDAVNRKEKFIAYAMNDAIRIAEKIKRRLYESKTFK